MMELSASPKPASLCARRSSAGPSPEEPDSRESRDRRQLHPVPQSDRGAARRSRTASARPPRLETEAAAEKRHRGTVNPVATNDPARRSESVYSRAPDSTGGRKSLPGCCTQAGNQADIVSLRKRLGRARRLASAIKRGQSYFHLLQKEEREEREEAERQRMRREEQLRTEPRPPSFPSDSDSDSGGWPLPAGTSWSCGNGAKPRRKKKQSARPFTPVHYSLTSPLLREAPREVIYRQLCCLNWLLEALTVARPGRVGPLTACWDPKDPGRGTTTMKMLKKERAAENKWEQFVSSKPSRAPPKHRRSSSVHLQAFRRSSFMSALSLSMLTSTTVGSSLSSLVPGPEEDTGIPGAGEETELPPSDCLCTLSVVQQRLKKESQSAQNSSTAQSLKTSESKLQPLLPRTDNQTGSTVATASQPERERLNGGVRKRQVWRPTAKSPHALHRVTYKSQETEAPNNINSHSNNMWLSALLSGLPEEVCKEQAVSRVLQKLMGFAEQRTLSVRPQLFLMVLGGLEPWELCLPELCVAVQIAMEHVVQISREEYDAWLLSRVTLPP